MLEGSTPRFGVESAAIAAAGTRWWSFVATRLNRPEGGAVVTLTEITEQRRAEIEARQSRSALAHVERVSTIGELTASLAHQLSQPLTGIMSNTQAVRHLLERFPTDFDELRDATSDIVEDARRAGDIVLRLRELLRRGEFNMTSVDLCAVIRDVVKLVDSDAIIRKVTISLEVDGQPLVVRGDRVQLQQLILNLLVNGLEAIDDRDMERVIRVRCQRYERARDPDHVCDSGTGLPAGAEDLIFDPFYTTKPDGMGMGLSIARSIVETHGGSIHARNVHGGGAVVEFSLPPAESVELV